MSIIKKYSKTFKKYSKTFKKYSKTFKKYSKSVCIFSAVSDYMKFVRAGSVNGLHSDHVITHMFINKHGGLIS